VELPAPTLPRFSEPTQGWRKAAIVVGCIAAVELIALVVVALAFIAKPFADDSPAKAAAKPSSQASATTAATAENGGTATVKVDGKAGAKVTVLPRAKTGVLVLNGNGYVGAAAEKASVVQSLRYRVTNVGDAPQRDFPQTIVMYRPGFQAEALRLTKDMGMPRRRAVPLDGMRTGELHGARLVLIVGNQA
jgi:hypothetical protein